MWRGEGGGGGGGDEDSDTDEEIDTDEYSDEYEQVLREKLYIDAWGRARGATGDTESDSDTSMAAAAESRSHIITVRNNNNNNNNNESIYNATFTIIDILSPQMCYCWMHSSCPRNSNSSSSS